MSLLRSGVELIWWLILSFSTLQQGLVYKCSLCLNQSSNYFVDCPTIAHGSPSAVQRFELSTFCHAHERLHLLACVMDWNDGEFFNNSLIRAKPGGGWGAQARL